MFLPCKECKGRCCSYPVFSEAELSLVKLARGVPPGATVMASETAQSYNSANNGRKGYVLFLKGGTCPYLENGGCSIYSIRPQVCKDYGLVPDLPCEYLYPKEAEAKQMARLKASRP